MNAKITYLYTFTTPPVCALGFVVSDQLDSEGHGNSILLTVGSAR